LKRVQRYEHFLFLQIFFKKISELFCCTFVLPFISNH
jgi:hypothetical protein